MSAFWSEKLKTLSVIIFILEIIGVVICACKLFFAGQILWGLLTLLIGAVIGLGFLALSMAIVELSEKVDSMAERLRQESAVLRSSFDAKPGADEWKCPKCGKINKNYVGTCACGQTKQ